MPSAFEKMLRDKAANARYRETLELLFQIAESLANLGADHEAVEDIISALTKLKKQLENFTGRSGTSDAEWIEKELNRLCLILKIDRANAD